MTATDAPGGGFRRWRRSRPFWGGLLLLTAGLELFLSANLTLGDLEVHMGPEGFLSYLLPLLLVLSGALSWVTPGQRLFYGILGLLTAVYSLVGLNLGGFGLGMLIGIIGGALVLAWAPTRPEPVQQVPGEPAYRDPEPPPEEGTPRPPSDGLPGRTFVIALGALALTATFLVAGGRSPARAAVECPEGLPSRPAARQSSATPPPSRTAARKPPSASAEPAVSPSASPEATGGTGKSGNPVVDGWNGFVEGLGDLLGIGKDEKGGAEADPTGSATPPAPAPSGKPRPTDPGAIASGTASPSPAPGPSDIPCLGPRVFKNAGPDDTPLVSVTGSILETDRLTMYNSTYDGVAELDTAKGKLAALKFSMGEAVNEPFSLTVPEPGGRTTLITSRKLITRGDVRFYTPEFKGKLFGLVPVTFTPESPPPLTLPVLWFTDVTINLAFVRCDTLTGVPLRVSAKA